MSAELTERVSELEGAVRRLVLEVEDLRSMVAPGSPRWAIKPRPEFPEGAGDVPVGVPPVGEKSASKLLPDEAKERGVSVGQGGFKIDSVQGRLNAHLSKVAILALEPDYPQNTMVLNRVRNGQRDFSLAAQILHLCASAPTDEDFKALAAKVERAVFELKAEGIMTPAYDLELKDGAHVIGLFTYLPDEKAHARAKEMGLSEDEIASINGWTPPLNGYHSGNDE